MGRLLQRRGASLVVDSGSNRELNTTGYVLSTDAGEHRDGQLAPVAQAWLTSIACLVKPRLYFDEERRDAKNCGHIDRPTRSINLATIHAVAPVGVRSINGAQGSVWCARDAGRDAMIRPHIERVTR